MMRQNQLIKQSQTNETQSPVQDEADGVVYQKLSGSRSAYWYLRPVWFICGATGERREDDLCERMIDADRSRVGSKQCLL